MTITPIRTRPRKTVHRRERMRAAEFFAGIGLVRQALELSGFRVSFANDIEPFKRDLYAANFGAEEFVLDDIRNIHGTDVPDVDLATASFPCTDLSLAGARRGLAGSQSGLFWEFTRVLEEMADRHPSFVLIENVPGLLTSRGGQDLRSAVARLNDLGYACDLLLLDASYFVPQSRQRLFIVGSPRFDAQRGFAKASELRPDAILSFAARNRDLDLRFTDLEPPAPLDPRLETVVEKLDAADERWWEAERIRRFLDSLSDLQSARLRQRVEGERSSWATAYRRTRHGKATWEVRADARAGCLRTARGGSSKQALVEAGRGEIRIRWMTSREYARLQGAPDYHVPPSVTENQALFGFGDAVCVPAVQWVIDRCVAHALHRMRAGSLPPR